MAYLGDDGKWYYNIVRQRKLDDEGEAIKIEVESVIGPFETEDHADHDASGRD